MEHLGWFVKLVINHFRIYKSACRQEAGGSTFCRFLRIQLVQDEIGLVSVRVKHVLVLHDGAFLAANDRDHHVYPCPRVPVECIKHDLGRFLVYATSAVPVVKLWDHLLDNVGIVDASAIVLGDRISDGGLACCGGTDDDECNALVLYNTIISLDLSPVNCFFGVAAALGEAVLPLLAQRLALRGVDAVCFVCSGIRGGATGIVDFGKAYDLIDRRKLDAFTQGGNVLLIGRVCAEAVHDLRQRRRGKRFFYILQHMLHIACGGVDASGRSGNFDAQEQLVFLYCLDEDFKNQGESALLASVS